MKERKDRIGSNLGLRTRDMIEIIIEQSRVPVVVNAGIDLPSHAAEAIELGADAVLANTAVAAAGDPVKMAEAFKLAVRAAEIAVEARPPAPRSTASAASPAGQYASMRCSEHGYWNSFVPVLDFSSVRAYAKSIAQYVQKGLLVAHYNFRDTLHVWRDEDAVAFSTHPLSVGTWEPAPFTSLVAAKDGEVVRVSPPHGNEYIYNPNDYRMVYMEFARL